MTNDNCSTSQLNENKQYMLLLATVLRPAPAACNCAGLFVALADAMTILHATLANSFVNAP